MARTQRGQDADPRPGKPGQARIRLTGFEQVLIGLLFAKPGSGYDLKRFFASTPASVYQPSSGALYPALRRLERAGLLRTARPPEGEVSCPLSGGRAGDSSDQGASDGDEGGTGETSTGEDSTGETSTSETSTTENTDPHQSISPGEKVARPAPWDAARPTPTRRQRYEYYVTELGAAVHAEWIREPVNPATVSQDLDLHMMRFVMMERQLPRADVLAFLTSLRAALADFVAGIERYLAALDPPEPDDMYGHLALEHGVVMHRASLDWTARAIAALTRAPAG